MNKKHAQLRKALTQYTLEHWIDDIPYDYFEKMSITWLDMNNKGYNWDQNKAAAALLYAAVIDGFIHNSQVTVPGYKALDWAERFLQKLDRIAA